MALVQIPSVTATQLISTTRTPLASGTLTLTLPPSSPHLLLTLGPLTLPLTPSTTISSKNLTYHLTLPLSPTTTTIELTLPPSANDPTSPTSTSATEFERILANHGFLLTGLAADADDLSHTLKETAAKAARSITASADRRVAGREQVEEDEETRFAEGTHRVFDTVADGSGKVAELSGRVAGAVSAAMFEAGKWIGGKLAGEGEKSLQREVVEEGKAVGVAVEGIGQSAAMVAGAVGDGVERVVEHEHGQEAKELVGSARETAGNLGHVVVDATLGTSVVWQAGEAGVGVARAGMENAKV